MKLIQWLIDLLKMLFGKLVSRPADKPETEPSFGEPAVMKRARRDIGQKEIPGPAANPVIMAWWRHVDYKPPGRLVQYRYVPAATNAPTFVNTNMYFVEIK